MNTDGRTEGRKEGAAAPGSPGVDGASVENPGPQGWPVKAEPGSGGSVEPGAGRSKGKVRDTGKADPLVASTPAITAWTVLLTEQALLEVRRSAERGASTRTHMRRAIQDAGEKAIEAFEMAALSHHQHQRKQSCVGSSKVVGTSIIWGKDQLESYVP